jgi:hypothetical protein
LAGEETNITDSYQHSYACIHDSNEESVHFSIFWDIESAGDRKMMRREKKSKEAIKKKNFLTIDEK